MEGPSDVVLAHYGVKGQATVAYLLAGSNAGKAYRKFATR